MCWRQHEDRASGPFGFAHMRAKSLQSCPALCDPVDCSLPGSSVHETIQARTLEWVAIFFSKGSSRPRDQACISYVSYTGRQVLHHQYHLGGLSSVFPQDWASLLAHMVKNPPAIWETCVQSLGWEDSGEGHGYPLQYSCLENPMDRGA